MRRGEIWTVAGYSDYGGKPRPMLILQDDQFDATESIIFCQFTTYSVDAELFRLPVLPDNGNGLLQESRVMVDRISTTPRSKLGKKIGRLADRDMVRVNQAILVFLGLAGA